MGLLEKYLYNEIEQLELKWKSLSTDAEKMENKNLRQEMIDMIAFYLTNMGDGEPIETSTSNSNLDIVSNTEGEYCECDNKMPEIKAMWVVCSNCGKPIKDE